MVIIAVMYVLLLALNNRSEAFVGTGTTKKVYRILHLMMVKVRALLPSMEFSALRVFVTLPLLIWGHQYINITDKTVQHKRLNITLNVPTEPHRIQLIFQFHVSLPCIIILRDSQ